MVLIFKIVINLIRELNAVFHYPAGHVMLGIRDLVEISFFIDAWDFVNIFPIKIYALSIASHFLETRYVATFYWIVLDIFWVTGWFVLKNYLPIHPKVLKKTVCKNNLHMMHPFHRRCVVIDCAQLLSFLFQAALVLKFSD